MTQVVLLYWLRISSCRSNSTEESQTESHEDVTACAAPKYSDVVPVIDLAESRNHRSYSSRTTSNVTQGRTEE